MGGWPFFAARGLVVALSNGKKQVTLAPLLPSLGVAPTAGQAVSITGVAYDSRQVEPGNAFVCIAGNRVDGHQFIAEAVARGASCIFSERAGEVLSVPLFTVADARYALAHLADFYYGSPSNHLRLLGVTGTNGKTTTTHLVEHILNAAGIKTALVGTLGCRFPGQDYHDVKHTTPQSADLHRILAEARAFGCTHVSMEVSSHALAQQRVGQCQFAVACLTNITQDHLDFHQTMEHYWRSKRKLFEQLSESVQSAKTAILNADDEMAPAFAAALSSNVRRWTYGWMPGADTFVRSYQFDFEGTAVTLATPYGDCQMKLRLAGKFNVYNVMAAISICLAESVSLSSCVSALQSFAGVAGRFEVVFSQAGGEPLVIVDYAHTPDGLDNVLKAARSLVPDRGKLIGLFGCGGDRDSSKRPQMGEIAEALCDCVYVTSDNPRTEDPQQIIADILAGVKRLKSICVEPDRAKAIRRAIAVAKPCDVVVIAGKGHENYQIIGDRTVHFDDREEARLALAERGKAGRESGLAK